MLYRRLLTAAALVTASTAAVSVASSSPAAACQPQPTSVYLEAMAPALGQDDVPLDAAVVATLKLDIDGNPTGSIGWVDYGGQTFTLELFDAGGAPVAGQTLKSFPAFEVPPVSDFVTLAFDPDAPLSPETTYRRTIVQEHSGGTQVVHEDTFTTASADATFTAASWSGDVGVEYTEVVSEIIECCPVDLPDSCGDEYCDVVSYDYAPVLFFSFEPGEHPLGRGALSYEVQQLTDGEAPAPVEEAVDPAGSNGRPYGEPQISVKIPVASAAVDDCYQVVARDAASDEIIAASALVCVTPEDFEPIERRDESQLGLECGDVEGGGGEGGGGEGGGGEGGGGEGGGGEGGGGTGGGGEAGGGGNPEPGSEDASEAGGCSSAPTSPTPLSILIVLGFAMFGLTRRQASKG